MVIGCSDECSQEEEEEAVCEDPCRKIPGVSVRLNSDSCDRPDPSKCPPGLGFTDCQSLSKKKDFRKLPVCLCISCFSRSYCCAQYDRLLAWYCRFSVCLSVCLCRSILWRSGSVYGVESCTVVSWDGTSYLLLQTLLMWDLSFSHNTQQKTEPPKFPRQE